MQVSFEDVANGSLIGLCGLQVDLHVALRVDDNGLALGRQHVGSVRQTAQIKLLEVHSLSPSQMLDQFYLFILDSLESAPFAWSRRFMTFIGLTTTGRCRTVSSRWRSAAIVWAEVLRGE